MEACDPKSIAARIENILDEKGISRKTLFEEARISKAALSFWRNGKAEPNDSSLQRIADALGVPLRYIKYGDGEYQIDTPETARAAEIVRPNDTDAAMRLFSEIYGMTNDEIAKMIEFAQFIKSKRRNN